jgi:hypothetical protein
MFTVTLRDHPTPPGLPRLTVRSCFWSDPRLHPDFAWMWLTRFLVFLAEYSYGGLYSCAGCAR